MPLPAAAHVLPPLVPVVPREPATAHVLPGVALLSSTCQGCLGCPVVSREPVAVQIHPNQPWSIGSSKACSRPHFPPLFLPSGCALSLLPSEATLSSTATLPFVTGGSQCCLFSVHWGSGVREGGGVGAIGMETAVHDSYGRQPRHCRHAPWAWAAGGHCASTAPIHLCHSSRHLCHDVLPLVGVIVPALNPTTPALDLSPL